MTATFAPSRSNTASASAANPARLRSVDLAGPAGRLEAILNEGSPHAHFAALVCQPHPSGGGSMHNKVVYRAMKVLNHPAWGLALPVLRFNFRGTGLSQGAHDGKLECGDVLAAIDWIENEYKLPLIVAGFSFGAAMALKACCSSNKHRSSIRAVAALGLPTQAEGREYKYRFLSDCAFPKLFLSGDHDPYAPATQLAQVVESAAKPKRLQFIPGADHFFTGQLDSMQEALGGWLKEQLQ
jgi:alpha/beta superfamily hydrolase